MDSLENTIDDLRDEVQAENASTRALFHQTCTHITDSLVAQDITYTPPPRYPRTTRRVTIHP